MTATDPPRRWRTSSVVIGAVGITVGVLVVVAAIQAATSSDDPPETSAEDRRRFCASMELIDVEAVVGLRAADLGGPTGASLVFSDSFVRGAPADVRDRAAEVVDAMGSVPEDGFPPERRDQLSEDLLALQQSAGAACEDVQPEP
jgi:hypothetical protein